MMIRVVNFLCVALLGLAILGNYRVSEQTRLARVILDQVDHRIAQEKANVTVLEAEWERVAGPARIQMLAQSKLGMSDGASVQLSALELLPRRGEDSTLGGSEVRQASAQIAEPSSGLSITPVSDTRQ
jgi:cell division protein FtsL